MSMENVWLWTVDGWDSNEKMCFFHILHMVMVMVMGIEMNLKLPRRLYSCCFRE